MFYVYCEDPCTREGWLVWFKTKQEALDYIKGNYDCACNLIEGKEIEFFMKNGNLELS